MNIVDWVLLGAVAVFALAGWLRGFVAGLLSFVGFIGGALLAAHFVPSFLDPVAKGAPWRVPALVLIVIVAAVLGEVVSGAFPRQHRRRSPERICPCHHRLDSRLNSHPGSLPSGGPADPALQGALHSGLTRTRSSPYGVLAPSVGRVVVNPVECDGWTVTSGWTGSGSAKRQRH